MKQKKKVSSREVGLKIGWLCGEYFLKMEHLHYGYWPDDLDVDITHLRLAQEEYVKFLTSHIPEGVKTILDVGCGAGRVARKLISMGYQVECVSPSPYLTEQARQSVGDQCRIFNCKYQHMETDKRYDLIMFVESFQYISLLKALKQTARFLNPGGHMLICDVFKKDMKEEGKQKGGHLLSSFFTHVEACPFKLIEDIDITEQTAPTVDLLNDALVNVGKPVMDSINEFLADRYPTIHKLVTWKFRDDLDKIDKKYFGGKRAAEQFKQFKSYRLLLYRKDS
ncbi:MAG: class I SAM-dependent methyltransferase [Sedimentisphaerales bacterium]|nr:class I SAM-dependent methyltransferase [Sedimentisphaerales bacterium]